MQYQQQPPPKSSGGGQGCLGACFAALCCCCVMEEGCELCVECMLFPTPFCSYLPRHNLITTH